MAAKSPTPPESILNSYNNNNATNNSTTTWNNLSNNNNSSIPKPNEDNQPSISIDSNLAADPSATPLVSVKPNRSSSSSSSSGCARTNITIMHLFHEMKQEFPTIPDTVVAEYVNRYCHQRNESVTELRRKLATYSMRLLSLPTKSLQRIQNSNSGGAGGGVTNSESVHREVLPKPLQPIRPAPPQPQPRLNPELNLAKPPDAANPNNTKQQQRQNIYPVQNVSNRRIQDTKMTKTRPTTLNLQQNRTVYPQKQCHLLNIHLQQQQQQSKSTGIKPIRKAPPPPAPSQVATRTTTAASYAMSLQHQQRIALETASNTTSPLSESEISVNVSLSTSASSTPTSSGLSGQQANATASPLKSPKRHRSVIILQPNSLQLPNICNFQISTTTSTGESTNDPNTLLTIPTTTTTLITPTPTPTPPVSQKSFTSVNLTLRQPPLEVTNANNPPALSTIDILAGPIVKGAIGSGLTYSSTSYNAKNRCQKNFHITVTDEGGEISACQIATHPPIQTLENEDDQLLLPDDKQRRQHAEDDISAITANLHVVSQMQINEDAIAEAVIERQKKRRDKLAAVLREKKKRLLRIKTEINILMEPIQPDMISKLDVGIDTLRDHCQELINRIENFRRNDTNYRGKKKKKLRGRGGQLQPVNKSNQQIGSQFIQSQTFLQFRSPSRQQQHCSQISSSSSTSSPSSQATPALQQFNSPTADIKISSTNNVTDSNADGCAQAISNIEAHHQFTVNLDNTTISQTDPATVADRENGGEVMASPWECNMCTFHNHPELNTCECCDNVRIIPDAVRQTTEDICITVTPGGPNRIVHSWILS